MASRPPVSYVQDFIDTRLKHGPVHVTLIDPDKQLPDQASKLALEADKGGTHIFLVGGTTGVDQQKLDTTIGVVREVTNKPIIIFPTTHTVLSCDADAVFYMSLMNSSNVDFVVREAVKASLRICELELEPMSVGYLVFSPGMTVGKVGNVDLIERDDVRSAMEYAKSIELFGMKFCYLEGGSGVKDPIPTTMIESVRSVIKIPLILGGGVKDPETARSMVRAGADIIVTGNMVEQVGDLAGSVEDLISSMEKGWKERS